VEKVLPLLRAPAGWRYREPQGVDHETAVLNQGQPGTL
jgi:hypothetical protein